MDLPTSTHLTSRQSISARSCVVLVHMPATIAIATFHTIQVEFLTNSGISPLLNSWYTFPVYPPVENTTVARRRVPYVAPSTQAVRLRSGAGAVLHGHDVHLVDGAHDVVLELARVGPHLLRLHGARCRGTPTRWTGPCTRRRGGSTGRCGSGSGHSTSPTLPRLPPRLRTSQFATISNSIGFPNCKNQVAELS